MSDETTPVAAPDTPNLTPRLYGIALLITAIILAGCWLVARYTSADLSRDLQGWREKLNLIAESRDADVTDWISGHFKELRTLSSNPSLQLYMTELEAMPQTDKDKPETMGSVAEPAQKAYLRNLLLFTAEHGGFSTPPNREPIPANAQPPSKSGLAILGADNQIIASTSITPYTRDQITQHAAATPPGQEGLIDLGKDDDGNLFIGFIVPIFSIQGEPVASSQIGRVVGILPVGSNLFGLLKHPGVTEKTLETILVRPDNGLLQFVSPLEDGTAALSKVADDKLTKSAEAALVQTPGDFVSDKKDYRDKYVLATSRKVAGTPWTLIVKVDKSEALAAGDQRRADMIALFFMLICVILLIVIAVWRYAYSKQAMMMSHYFRKLAAQAKAQEMLLRVVADHQPEPIYIVDAAQICQFANKPAADEAGMLPENMAGKNLADVRGTARAAQIMEQCRKSLVVQDTIYDEQHVGEGKAEKIIRSAYVPLEHIPIASLPEPTPGVLVVEQDISEAVHEREQRLATQRQLVQTLTKLVDRRDPFAANHSLLVSQVAYEIATEMDLDTVTLETARTAGCLMNIGKIIVPTELLTKTESLTSEEKNIIRESMHAAAELLKDVTFDGPVAETLRQWQEKWDGTGPLGLKGDGILMSARIIAVANAFIGMISPRSWRTAIPMESANKFLLEQSDTHFDRRVVVALVNYVENHSGKAWLKQILDGQKSVA